MSAVPHGLNIFLNRDFTNHLRLSLTSVVQDRDNPDFSGRRVFTNYIVQSNEMLSLMSSWGLPESKIEILESPRFTYEWIEILDEVWGDEVAGAETRSMIQQGLPFFTFFLPHWTYNVDKDAVIGLLMRMRDSGLNCIIRTHTRRSGELTRSEIEMLSSENLVIDALTPSSVLIRHSTGVISFGTSVALEALARQVPVIHASHLHDNITIFDEMSEGLISVENNDKVMEEAIKILEARQSGQSKSRARPQVDERSLGEILGKYVEVICGEE